MVFVVTPARQDLPVRVVPRVLKDRLEDRDPREQSVLWVHRDQPDLGDQPVHSDPRATRATRVTEVYRVFKASPVPLDRRVAE